MKLSHGKAYVYDDENNKLTPIAIPQEEAKLLLDHLVPEEKEKDDGGTKT
ncbi:MAG: hypothetical protein IIC21_09210 [Chloroflexi bacterium]|nr:hypothetical protein [Chloroflexota bacterium]